MTSRPRPPLVLSPLAERQQEPESWLQQRFLEVERQRWRWRWRGQGRVQLHHSAVRIVGSPERCDQPHHSGSKSYPRY